MTDLRFSGKGSGGACWTSDTVSSLCFRNRLSASTLRSPALRLDRGVKPFLEPAWGKGCFSVSEPVCIWTVVEELFPFFIGPYHLCRLRFPLGREHEQELFTFDFITLVECYGYLLECRGKTFQVDSIVK